MKKPDRFERIVAKAQAVPGSYGRRMLDKDEIVILLRAEHRAVVGVVTRYKESRRPPDNDRCVDSWESWAYVEKSCNDILAALAARTR